MAEAQKTDEELNREIIARQDVSQHPRMLAMDQIAAQHEGEIAAQHAAEGIEIEGIASAHAAAPSAPQAPAAPAPAPVAAAPAPAAPAATPAAPKVDDQLLAQFGDEPVPMEALDSVKVKVKVDGQERVMTVHDLRRAVQLDGAAQSRLEQANEILKQARAHAAATPAQQPPVGVAPAPAPGQSSPASKDVTQETRAFLGAIFEGDEGKAAALLGDLLASRQTPAPQQVDPASIAQQAASQVRQQLSVEEANAQFRSDFPEVVGDPLIAGVADQFFAEVTALDPQKSYAQALSEAGTRTREWLASKGVKPATEPARGSTRQEKLEAKRAMDGKEVRGLNRTETKQEPAVPTTSDVIAEMRAQRGLS